MRGAANSLNDFLPLWSQVNGLFFAIGYDPASKFLDGQLELDAGGYIKTIPGCTTTNVPGGSTELCIRFFPFSSHGLS